MNGRTDPQPDAARRWLSGAANALESARHQLTRVDLPAGIACFLAHLAAEKALKAVLVAFDRPFRKVHDLVELRRLIVSAGLTVGVGEQELRRLNPWSIDGRYAEDVPEAAPDLARELVEMAAAVVLAAEEAVDKAEDDAAPAELQLEEGLRGPAITPLSELPDDDHDQARNPGED
ncbi:MAG: HEPN domain-containing protein [Acidimicrobiales bacterium]